MLHQLVDVHVWVLSSDSAHTGDLFGSLCKNSSVRNYVV